jgi:acetyl-CoA carboxylase carboxyl transferase subunit alpha
MRPPYRVPAEPMRIYLDFEKQIAELDGRIEELRVLASDDQDSNVEKEIARLELKSSTQLKSLYDKLNPWQKTQVARHPGRPHFLDYVDQLIEDFTPLAGDRKFAEDEALLGGLGRFKGRSVVVMGHEKGSDTESRLKHNFGMARPEGYRKAVRLMDLAEQFDLPVISLVDTAGAYPGLGGEARGQAEAIARATQRCLSLKVPMVAVILGEGMSGGAIGIAAANKVYMLEHATYAVISPEGCASILWKDAAKAQEAATAMKITAQDCATYGIIDAIIDEPVGGAHRAPQEVIEATGKIIDSALMSMSNLTGEEIKHQRREKFLAMGDNGVG